MKSPLGLDFTLFFKRQKMGSALDSFCYGLPVLVSDIPANKEVELPAERYFRCGDIDDLKEKMEALLEKGLSEEERQKIRKQIEEKYNPSAIFRTYPCTICQSYRAGGAGWDKIAEQTIEVYRKLI